MILLAMVKTTKYIYIIVHAYLFGFGELEHSICFKTGGFSQKLYWIWYCKDAAHFNRNTVSIQPNGNSHYSRFGL